MELKGSKTEANLMEAFAGESQARNKYTYYASQAKKDGYVQISKIFACSFSLSAVFKNKSAICSKPSFFAFDAKYVYLLRACDSPEKAVLKFSSVFVPEYLFAIYITSVNLFIYNIYHYTRILNNIFLCLAFFRFLY